ncbi:M14/M99 family metallopeptidase [Candidatus Latescibacterota bacterium]
MVLLIMIAVFIGSIVPAGADSRNREITYYENSDHELTIYFIEGKESGATMMIIGGIQGDEPGGYLAADLYADILLKKGNLIVVPRANFYTIRKNKRGINGDMNRKFGPQQQTTQDFDITIVEVLKDFISQSDVLLNLHEGSGFYSPTYISDMRNPKRYGQSIIADESVYINPDGTRIDLEGPATRVINDINHNIQNSKNHFNFSNHNTRSKNTIHKEQRKSATFYALTNAGIPAFGLETSKSIKSLETKVYHQTLAINAFMKEYGIIPEHPSVSLPPPALDHLVVNVVGNPTPFAVKNGTALTVPTGSSIQVTSIFANYKRGLTLDIIGEGNTNDLGRVTRITKNTSIKVYKDAFPCGEINVSPSANNVDLSSKAVSVSTPVRLKKLHINVAGKNVVVSPSDTLHIIKGDIIRIADVDVNGTAYSDIRVNFVGYVGNPRFNDGDDRGYSINTASNLIDRFSSNGLGEIFRVEALYEKKVIGTIFIELHNPELEYLIVERDDGTKQALTLGDTYSCNGSEKITIVKVVSNISCAPFVETYLSSDVDTTRELPLPTVIDTSGNFDLLFRRATLELGTISFRTRL